MRSMRNAGGYVRVYRSMLEWEWYDDGACCRLMLHLLLSVNWEPKEWHGQQIAPGQLVTSIDKLAGKLRLSRSAIRRALDKLKSTGETTVHTNNHWTTITLANWAEYQEGQPTNGRQKSQPTADQRPTSDRPAATTKEGNKGRREEGNTAGPGFDEFYAAYPVHKAKGNAVKAWARLTDSERTLCLPAIAAQVKAQHFRGADGKDYIPHPASWLNARRWEDEVKISTGEPAPTVRRAAGWLEAK